MSDPEKATHAVYCCDVFYIFENRQCCREEIVVTEPTDQHNELITALNDSMNILVSTIKEISAQIKEISVSSGITARMAQKYMVKLRENDDVLILIKNIAEQSNVLGLYDAIEATQVSEAGREFGAVVEEIRKFAVNSSQSIESINNTVNMLQEETESTYCQITQINDVMFEIAKTLANIAIVVQQTGVMSFKLNVQTNRNRKE